MNSKELKHFGMGGLVLVTTDGGDIYHHGIKGMKWGIRRYQNKDGALTKAGKKRVAKEITKAYRKGLDNGHKNGDKSEEIQKARNAIKPERQAYASARSKLDALESEPFKDNNQRIKLFKKAYDSKKREYEEFAKEHPGSDVDEDLRGLDSEYKKAILRGLDSEYKKAISSEENAKNSWLKDHALRSYRGANKSFDKKYNEAEASLREARSNLSKATDKYIKNLLGDIGNKSVKSPIYNSNGRKTGNLWVSPNVILETKIGELSFSR